jgi:hypothetical protein
MAGEAMNYKRFWSFILLSSIMVGATLAASIESPAILFLWAVAGWFVAIILGAYRYARKDTKTHIRISDDIGSKFFIDPVSGDVHLINEAGRRDTGNSTQ